MLPEHGTGRCAGGLGNSLGSQQVSRNYHLRGRILQVPSNYNPQTRQYNGIWDGTFKPAYSNNMVLVACGIC
ncbi:hypothetical protein AB2F28_06805 [Escherichia coli]